VVYNTQTQGHFQQKLVSKNKKMKYKLTALTTLKEVIHVNIILSISVVYSTRTQGHFQQKLASKNKK